jgi:hypothetical protein
MPDSLNRREVLQTLAASSLAFAARSAAAAETSEICSMTAVQMAGLIRSKKLSARETIAAHLKQIDRLNPRVNSIVTLVAD